MRGDESGSSSHQFGFSSERGPYDRMHDSWKNMTSGLSGVIARMIASASTAWSACGAAPKRQFMFHCRSTWLRRVRRHKDTTAAKARGCNLSDSQPHGLLGPVSGQSIGLNCRTFVNWRRLRGESTRILRTAKVSYCC